MVKGQVNLIDLEDFHARWQRLLPLSNETRPYVMREQLLSKLPWIKEKVFKKDAKNSQGSIARAVMWWPHSKKNSGNIALNVALRFLRLFPIWGRGC